MPEQDNTQIQPNEARERRSVSKPIRWKPSEINDVESRAKSYNADFAEYVRAAAMNKQPKPITQATGERLQLIQAMGELGKVGSNLNQLAKRRNQGHYIEENAIIRAAQAVEQCADTIRSILLNSQP